MIARKRALTVALIAAAATTLTACGSDNSELRQISPGTVVYIDAWDENGDRGDQAQVEQKPSGLWVVPLQSHFRKTKAKASTSASS